MPLLRAPLWVRCAVEPGDHPGEVTFRGKFRGMFPRRLVSAPLLAMRRKSSVVGPRSIVLSASDYGTQPAGSVAARRKTSDLPDRLGLGRGYRISQEVAHVLR